MSVMISIKLTENISSGHQQHLLTQFNNLHRSHKFSANWRESLSDSFHILLAPPLTANLWCVKYGVQIETDLYQRKLLHCQQQFPTQKFRAITQFDLKIRSKRCLHLDFAEITHFELAKLFQIHNTQSD